MNEYSLSDISWLAIIVGAFVPMVVGFIWYNPKLFGNIWMDSLGFTEEDLKGGNMAAIFGLSFLMSAILAYAVSSYLNFHPEEFRTFTHGAFHGVMGGVTLVIPVLVSNSLFERRNLKNILVNASYWLVTMGLLGGVVSFFV